MDLFQEASRIKLRFKTNVGIITTEDLWDLNLTNIDHLAITLRKQLKEEEEESFVKRKLKTNNNISLQFEIVKEVIKIRLNEAEIAKTKIANKARREKILEAISQKSDENLRTASIEELQKELDSIDD